MIDRFEERLRHALSSPLPGASAHARMAPRPRPGWKPGATGTRDRAAAALVLVFPRDGALRLVLTVRQSHLPVHPGQVSLPGGAVDPGESLVEAAFREAREELACDTRALALTGALTPLHIPVSGYVVHPYIAVATCEPAFTPLDAEVARILEPAIDELSDPRHVHVERRTHAGAPVVVPYFAIEGEKVWGATAMILAEFLTLLGTPPDPPALTPEESPS